jgi:protein-S-isoprenylcysteine O-methyltransferase Ste14
MITPDFGWSHRLLPLNALTGHGCTNLATGREGGTVPKTIAILGSALFFAVAPSTVAGLVPWWITRWEFLPPFFDLQATRAVGILLIVAGLPGLVDSFARFALQGLGTPAPIAPTQNLVLTGVLTGLYRYVRNPIYVAVVAVILGQAILFGDWRLMTYGGLMWLAFHAFVLTYEEPVLAQKFGAQYEDFRANVPRWIPRLSPWRTA